MKAFKLFFKLVFKDIVNVVLLIILLSVMVVIYKVQFEEIGGDFTLSKAFLTYDIDEENEYTDNLKLYLAPNVRELEKGSEKVQKEALASGLMSAVIKIETKNLTENNIPKIEYITYAQNDSSQQSLKIKLDEFNNFVYRELLKGKSLDEASINAYTTLSSSNVEVSMIRESSNELLLIAAIFTFASYLIFIIISTIGKVVLAIHQRNVYRRMKISSYSAKVFYLELILASIVFMIGVITIIFILLASLSKDVFFTHIEVLYFFINLFVFTLPLVLFGVILGLIFKKAELLDGLSTGLGLIISFFSGAFIPQSYLDEGLLNVSKMFPSYYFIKNNDLISDGVNLSGLGNNFLIMFGFALVYLVIIFIIINRRKKTA